MKQLTLLQLEPAPPPWVCIYAHPPSPHKVYRHHPSGWIVEHCGHPTANYPYLIYTAAGEPITAPNGMAWQYLKDAKAEVERRTASLF